LCKVAITHFASTSILPALFISADQCNDWHRFDALAPKSRCHCINFKEIACMYLPYPHVVRRNISVHSRSNMSWFSRWKSRQCSWTMLQRAFQYRTRTSHSTGDLFQISWLWSWSHQKFWRLIQSTSQKIIVRYRHTTWCTAGRQKGWLQWWLTDDEWRKSRAEGHASLFCRKKRQIEKTRETLQVLCNLSFDDGENGRNRHTYLFLC
jgi:hypothetical protein